MSISEYVNTRGGGLRVLLNRSEEVMAGWAT